RCVGPVANVGAGRAADALRSGRAVVARARLALVRHVLVDEAVAVVVEVVADLGRRRARGIAHARGERALPTVQATARDLNAAGARLALGRVRRRAHAANLNRRGHDEVLVDLPVAVVVLAVARLLRRNERAG